MKTITKEEPVLISEVEVGDVISNCDGKMNFLVEKITTTKTGRYQFIGVEYGIAWLSKEEYRNANRKYFNAPTSDRRVFEK